MLVRCNGPSLPSILDVAPNTIVADRFVRDSGAKWIDLATGASVALRVWPVDSATAPQAHADRGAALVSLWHPHLLTPIDYGLLGRDWRFEAWPPCRPCQMHGGRRAAQAIRSALSFLQAQGLALGRAGWGRVRESGGRVVLVPDRGTACRSDLPGCRRDNQVQAWDELLGAWSPPAGLRIAGMRLLERMATRWVADVLDHGESGETRVVGVRAQAGAGVSKFVRRLARGARARGYVPIDAAVAAGRPSVLAALHERHVLVIDRPAGRHAATGLLLSLGVKGAHGVVVLSIGPAAERATARGCEPGPQVALDALPPERLAAAASIYPANAWAAPEILELARQSAGLPGRFVALLRGDPPPEMARRKPASWLVRESGATYVARPPSRVRPDIAGLRARAERGSALAGAGRHAAAERLLRATAAAFARRACQDEAAASGLRLVELKVRRGRIREAEAELRRLDRYEDPVVRLRATIASAAIRIDEARLVEAEHAARAASLAAARGQCRELECDAALVLARCLFWQGRIAEAGETLRSGTAVTPVQSVRVQSRLARVELARPNLAAAGRAAAAALASAETADGQPALAGARSAQALVLAAIGDVAGFREAIRVALDAARRAHDPLLALRVRLAAADGCGRLGLVAEAGGATLRLRRWLKRPLPSLLRGRVLQALGALGDQAAADEAGRFVRGTGACGVGGPSREDHHMEGLQELSDVLRICHEAQDEIVALGRVCAILRERLRAIGVSAVVEGGERAVAHAGALPARSSDIGARATAAGMVIGPTLTAGGIEAAAPLRYGGRTIGALVGRWPIDATLDGHRTGAILAAAAAACAPSMQAALDRRAVPSVANAPDVPALIGASTAIEGLREAARRAAGAPFSVLIEGESGSGKELVAHLIHLQSPRRDRRFCALNCAALTDDLLEAELFGHARGAFTGAIAERAGLFEEADHGTLLLDEVSELSPRAQAKLLRAIQDGEIRRVGENLPRQVDVRLVAATNRALDQEVTGGRFRADLRYRLDVIRIVVPPLRDRAEDIPELAAHFWAQAIRRTGSRATLDPDTLAALARYDWPGNVRELQNVMAALVVQAGTRGRVGPRALPECIARIPESGGASTLDAARESFERRFVRAALARAGGHRGRAARVLGISRQGLTKLLRRLDIDPAPPACESARIAR